MVKGLNPITHIDVEYGKCCDDTSKETNLQQKDEKNANSYTQESAYPPKKSNLKTNSNHKQEDKKLPKYKSTISPILINSFPQDLRISSMAIVIYVITMEIKHHSINHMEYITKLGEIIILVAHC